MFPTLVQGDQAADDIVRNIQRIEEIGTFDTMIIGRGGGSIEDLWPFNEERVARAIYQAHTPIISSVGHETDVTIADMVADVRAATPTAAAELAVPVLNEELLKIKERQTRLEQSFLYQLQQKNDRYQRLKNSYVFKQPDRLYEGQTIKLDRITQRLIQSMETVYHQKQRTAQNIIAQFRQQTPQGQIREGQQQLKFLNQSLHDRMERYMKDKEKQFTSAVQQLDLLSPLKIMGRGYSYTTKEQQVIKSVNELAPKEKIQIHYVDGVVDTVIEKITPAEEE